MTGVGGGTLRDLLIGAPVFWVHTNASLLICIGAALLVVAGRPARSPASAAVVRRRRARRLRDLRRRQGARLRGRSRPAFGMGVLTACAGGIIRDVLAGEPSILMRPELYVTAAALSAGLFVGCLARSAGARSPPLVAAVAGFALRGSGHRARLVIARLSRLGLPHCSIAVMAAAMDDEFYRIQRLPPYVFAEVNAMKAAARARGEDIIDLGMGNPDGAPPKHVIDKLAEVAAKPNAHRYSASRGIPGLRKAQAAYYQRRFGVTLDPDKEVIVTLGSKEGLANLAQAITAPGDVVLAPNPSYPIHTFGFIIAGAAIRSIPAAPGEDFFERLRLAMRFTVPRPKVLVIGYPSNPTAYVADLAFYERLVAFAREHELIVISDLAYAEIYFGDTPTPSILQVEGAKDVAVEFTSMSKTYTMAGWRIGFAVGNARLIAALARVKSYLDYGAFTPVQAAAFAALNGPQDIVEYNRELYKQAPRRAGRSFGRAGWDIPAPQASMFAWAPLPERFHELGSHRVLQAAADPSRCRGRPRASASARKAKASSASRWSRTSSACARRRAA